MTVIDEARLIDALRDAANAFEISEEATARVLNEARTAARESRSLHAPAFLRQPGRARTSLVAATLVLLVGAVSWPLLRGENQPSKNAFAPYSAHVPSTSSGRAKVTGAAPPQPPLGPRTFSSGPRTFSSAGGQKGVVTGTSFNAAVAAISPRIESTGSINLTVARGQVGPALSKLSSLATGDGGLVDSTQINAGSGGSGNFSNGSIVLQVPQRTFTTLIAQVQRVGHTTSLSTSSVDVTGQYVDLQARIAALQASRQQYLLIMTRATTISDILAVENQLSALQSQLEQLQAQLNVLNNQTTFATLTVMVHEVGQPTHSTHGGSGIAKAWHDAEHGFIAGFEWLIRISGPALFAAIMLALLGTLARFGWRAARRRRI